MYTNNCLYCEKVFENMTGKLFESVKKPDEFTHLQIYYEYYFCRNQPRIRNLRLQKIEHVSPDSLYNMKRR